MTTFREKILYHQIHPLKLFTDVGVTFPACYLLWRHDLSLAVAFAIFPPVIVSAVLIAIADLDGYKASAFGRYVARYMSREMEVLRALGFLLVAVGSWLRQVWLLPCGVAVVLVAWARGVIFPQA